MIATILSVVPDEPIRTSLGLILSFIRILIYPLVILGLLLYGLRTIAGSKQKAFSAVVAATLVILATSMVVFDLRHADTPESTERFWIGLFLYIPLVICPVLGVMLMLYLLRNLGVRGISVLNLISAAGLVLLFVSFAFVGARSNSTLPDPESVIYRKAFLNLFATIWFMGAIGLSFRKRLGWVVSLICVAACVVFFCVSLSDIAQVYLYPSDELNRTKDFGLGGYLFGFIFLTTVFSVLLAIAVWLLVKLLHIRREIFRIISSKPPALKM